MAENYLLNVDKVEDVAVRLIGFVNEKECEAILNVEDAARRISTAESIRTRDCRDAYGKRFIVVIRISSESFGDAVPSVFISPTITQTSYIQGNKEFGCSSKDGLKKYRFIPIENGAGV